MSSEKNERWHTIEGKHLGQCVWQIRSQNGKGLMEGLIHRATGRIMVVEKFLCHQAAFDEQQQAMAGTGERERLCPDRP